MKAALIGTALVAVSSAHGVIRSIQGANGVQMPGLSIADGTPRDCSTNGCGSQADTSIIRDREIASGKASPLGRTQGAGPVDAATMIAAFMGAGAATTNSTKASAAQVAADTALDPDNKKVRRALKDLLGALGGAGSAAGAGKTGSGKGGAGVATENIVSQMSGAGAASGLPTCGDDGSIKMSFYQINGDGAGPLRADIDPTSGGTNAAAFQTAQVTQDIPGVFSLSTAKEAEMPVTVQMPAGMTCNGNVGGASNVCVVRVRNSAAAGPFGGSAAFTQSNAAKKRALEYRMKKRAAMEMEFDA